MLPWRLPPATSTAPRATASAISASIRSAAAPLIERLCREQGIRPPLMLPSAHPVGVIGVVTLADCMPFESDGRTPGSQWAFGPFCWILRDPQALVRPLPYRGGQGIFDVPDALVAEALGMPV